MSVNRHPRLLTAGITFRDLVISGIDELPKLGEERYGTDFVATWGGAGTVGVVDPAEVALVQRVRLADLANPSARATTRHPSGYRGPAFVLPDLFVWGFTAHVLDALLDYGGWSRSWGRERMVEIPEEYLGAQRLLGGTL